MVVSEELLVAHSNPRQAVFEAVAHGVVCRFLSELHKVFSLRQRRGKQQQVLESFVRSEVALLHTLMIRV